MRTATVKGMSLIMSKNKYLSLHEGRTSHQVCLAGSICMSTFPTCHTQTVTEQEIQEDDVISTPTQKI